MSALAIGSGHSLGPEDLSLQIGAGVASLISRRFGLSKEKLRIFAPIGAAAGLAAAFNAPISAILFVIEEVIGQWSAAVLGSIVLAAVSSVVVARSFWGAEPMFRIPTVTLRDPRELLAYAALGVAGAFAALIFAGLLSYLRPRLRTQPEWSQLHGSNEERGGEHGPHHEQIAMKLKVFPSRLLRHKPRTELYSSSHCMTKNIARISPRL